MMPYRPPQPPVVRVQPRGRATGAIVSFFLPGVGSLVNGSVLSGLAIIVTWLIGAILTLVIGIGLIVMFAAWIWGILDGAFSADRWNRRHGVIS
jgi:TM2 domain-containing membrane protein YozV